MTSEEPIKISVVGTGKMGYYHARLLSRLGYLDSVVDSNPEIAESVGKQFKKPWFSSIDDMAGTQNPNGVIIAVPTETHVKVASEMSAVHNPSEQLAFTFTKYSDPSTNSLIFQPHTVPVRSFSISNHVAPPSGE